MAFKPPSETDQIMHVKKLTEAKKVIPEKILDLKGSCAPKPEWENLIVHEYSEEVFCFVFPFTCGN